MTIETPLARNAFLETGEYPGHRPHNNTNASGPLGWFPQRPVRSI